MQSIVSSEARDLDYINRSFALASFGEVGQGGEETLSIRVMR